jgi:hypothetical protein
LATRSLEHWCDHPNGASPLAYLAMLRYDTSRGVWRDVPGTGDVARALVDAGALIDGEDGDQETPLITAASYGDAEVAQVLIEAGADLEARAAEDAGGVPGGTALLHAAVFAMTEVVDVLVAAGAQVHGIEEAAAAGNVAGWLDAETPLDRRVRALVMASVLCRRGRAGSDDHPRFDEVEAILAPLTSPDPLKRRARENQQPAAAAARQLPSLTIEIRATNLPGRSCGPGPESQMYEDIHVGLACRGGTIELVRGDARRAGWTFDVTVRRDETGSLDYGSPFISGTRGARSVGLRWGTLTEHDEFEVFRAAKLRISDIDTALIEEAVRDRRHLVACLGLTDQHGHPVCATVRPPDIAWSIT